MEEAEFERFMNSDNGGKKLVWLNNFKEIEDTNLSMGGESTVKKYKG